MRKNYNYKDEPLHRLGRRLNLSKDFLLEIKARMQVTDGIRMYSERLGMSYVALIRRLNGDIILREKEMLKIKELLNF